jgi:hypothetical protein
MFQDSKQDSPVFLDLPNLVIYSDLVTYEVEINLNMLHVLMLNGIGRQIQGTDIITIDKCAAGQRRVQLHE